MTSIPAAARRAAEACKDEAFCEQSRVGGSMRFSPRAASEIIARECHLAEVIHFLRRSASGGYICADRDCRHTPCLICTARDLLAKLETDA